MDSLRNFFELIWLTLFQPVAMARVVMTRSYDRGTLWMGVTLVSILSVLLVVAVDLVSPVELPMGFTPPLYGLVMACVLIVLSMAVYLTGQMLGGKSTFPHMFALVIWLEMTAICVRTVQAVVGFISPSAASLVSVAGGVCLFIALLTFVNESHRFDSLPRAFATIVISVFGMAFGASFFLAVIGVSTQMEF